MDLSFNWINILILFGALNALIFGIVLMFQKNHPGSRFFAAFVFVLAYNGFETFNWSAGLDRYYLFFDLFSFITIFALGPSLYLYIRALLFPQQPIARQTVALHYSAFLFQLITRVLLLAYHVLWINKIIVSDVTAAMIINVIWPYLEPASVIIFLGYLVASIRLFLQSARTHQVKPSSRDKQSIITRWTRTLLVLLTILQLAWTVTVSLPYFVDISAESQYYPIELAVVFFTYWIVLNGYHKARLISGRRAPVAEQARWEEHFSSLRQAIEADKLFLDPTLNVAKLAEHTGIPARNISNALKHYGNTSFTDFVNQYRVKAVCTRMVDPAYQHYTILSAALECGFNSQATFQRAFRTHTGMSPRKYLNTHRAGAQTQLTDERVLKYRN